MMFVLSRRALLGMALAAATLAPAHAQPAEAFKTGKLAIVTEKGRHEFTVELAASDRQQMQGLMFRRSLAPDAGMLFDYKAPTQITMWMKNTFIPLDMIFIGADGRIVRIAERTVPHSEEIVASIQPARAVLEVNGGTAQRLGIKVGDKVIADALGLK
jgi:uncharacterized membrane protein (UPF0127 family)